METFAGNAPWYPPRSLERPPGQALARLRRRLDYLSGRQQRRRQAEMEVLENSRTRFRHLSEAGLANELENFRRHFSRDRGFFCRPSVARHRPAALALLAVYMERWMGMTPYRVQLLAALAMHQGALVQLAPGEGKTLALALVAALYGWTGRPCHVVTANDYLAQRDAELMAPFYRACGLRTVAVLPDQKPVELKRGYTADVVYATGKQLLADFLRDELLLAGVQTPQQRQLRLMRGTPDRMPVMRGLFAAVVDEADSVLIDEANTPLIISGPDHNPRLLAAVPTACRLAGLFRAEDHYRINPAYLAVTFTEPGHRLLDKLTADLPPLWRNEQRSEELLRQALLARDVFERNRHYVVVDDKIVIVDENTGRGMPDRQWSYGLHQAVEAREGVPLTAPSRTMARRSFQTFFRRYHRLCGASGTLQGIAGELWDSYDLLTVRVPSRLPSRLIVTPPAHFAKHKAKIQSLCDRTAELHLKELPVLIGTRRISDSETIAEHLRRRGIECAVLNARAHEQEAAIIAEAGQAGTVTVATNMAGRGIDINVPPEVASAGGLQVLMFEPHESRRVDWQLFGRSGRQGVPGRATMFVSAEDDLLQRHLPWFARWLLYLTNPEFMRGIALRIATQLSQWRAQRFLWRQRRRMVNRDKLIRDQLTFAERLKE
ncbi:hypothetical protein DSCO28_34440 [Desulfosarcina ovata subsp. sediminis]|uniref:Uncharacterized protein n=1 Tax=Desulfosarcina ovata subsp. sediminis TaxID=885957 RepID=A0A5K7ZKV9_9BACT|nr:prepilin peptidase [Desulfosarcina ovata]BBO82878.1 hypothetical protein DSCO28_34440 [Desulfosarcina ovata subsp. sediminis]